jgi:putative hemolysin
MTSLKGITLTVPKILFNSYHLSRKKYIYISDNRYVVKLAEDLEEIDALLKLRFEVFNLELHEGLDSSFLTLRDEDEFDEQCNHLIVIEKAGRKVIGTYRLQTYEMSQQGKGFYSATEFNLDKLGRKVLRKSVELGRACIEKNHRNGRILFLLWKGIAQYMILKQKRFLFGCCSITSQNPAEGKRFMDYMHVQGFLHDKIYVPPMQGYECYPPDYRFTGTVKEVVLPPLMDMYIRYGAKICGPPAIDRDFKTIDYLILLDVEALDEEVRKNFF